MSSNKFTALLLGMIVSTHSFANSEAEDIQKLINNVPANHLEREEELKRLEHVSTRLKHIATIEKSQAEIRSSRNETSGKPKEVSNIEQQLEQALNGAASNPVATSSSPQGTSGRLVFPASISLISLWGSPSDPVADVLVDQRSSEIKKGSIINGWKVNVVTAEYVDIQRKQSKQRVFYTNATGE